MNPVAPSRWHVLPVDRSSDGAAALAGALCELFEERTERVLVPAGPEEDLTALAADLTSRVSGLPDDVRLVMRTSGSTTGHGRLVGLTAAQLLASAQATDARLGGPATWVLALPPHHIAGLQVIARSLLAGRSPALIEGHVDAGKLVDALGEEIRRDPDGRVHISLVPTQLADVLRDADANDSLRRAGAVLVGGDSTPDVLIDRARRAGLALRLSYGMSETCGGCVYDGLPLDDVEVVLGDRLDRPRAEGRIWLSGPMVMSGYLDDDPGIVRAGDQRWIATRDLGHWVDGHLVVTGRIDDVIISGGLKISASDVRDAALATGLVRRVAVIGLPSERWGQVVCAVVATSASWSAVESARLRDGIGERIGRARAPRVVVSAPALPMLVSGKLDRMATIRLAGQAYRAGLAWTCD